MDCKQILRLYQRYIDGELDDGKSDEIENHVENCSRCKKVVIVERRFKSVIVRKITRDKAPPELKKKIKSKIFRNPG